MLLLTIAVLLGEDLLRFVFSFSARVDLGAGSLLDVVVVDGRELTVARVVTVDEVDENIDSVAATIEEQYVVVDVVVIVVETNDVDHFGE